MARPKLKIDPDQVKSLAAINCTVEEIASVLKCSPDTLERRFAGIIKEGRNTGKMSLRREMWKAVKEKGNITMMIWLSKQLLGYTDKTEAIIGLPQDQKGLDETIDKVIDIRLERSGQKRVSTTAV